MTTGDAGRSFWGPDGIWSRTTDFCVKAAVGFRALVARQAAAILRLRGLLRPCSPSSARRSRSRRACRGGRRSLCRPRAHGPSLPRRRGRTKAPDGGGDLTLDEVRPLLRKALKLTTPRSKQPTIGGGLNRSMDAAAGPSAATPLGRAPPRPPPGRRRGASPPLPPPDRCRRRPPRRCSECLVSVWLPHCRTVAAQLHGR